MSDFAKPAHELAGPDLPVPTIPNAAFPAAGLGLTLEDNGLLHPSVFAPTPTNNYVLTYDSSTGQQKWAAILQSQVTFDSWQSYTPAITGSGGNPTLGTTGLIDTGRYVQVGKTVIGFAKWTVASVGYVNGTGNVIMSLPVTASGSTATNAPFGNATYVDVSAARTYVLSAIINTTTTVIFRADVTAFLLGYATPATIAAGDEVAMAFAYEAA